MVLRTCVLLAVAALPTAWSIRDERLVVGKDRQQQEAAKEGGDDVPAGAPKGDHIWWSDMMMEDFPAREILDENVLYVQYFPFSDSDPLPIYLLVKNPALNQNCSTLPGRKKGGVADPRKECLEKTTGVDWKPGEAGMPSVDQIQEVDFLATSYKWTPPQKWTERIDPLDPEGKRIEKVKNYPSDPMPTQRVFEPKMIDAEADLEKILVRLSGASAADVKSSLEQLFALESESYATFNEVPRDCSSFFDDKDFCKKLIRTDRTANAEGKAKAKKFNEDSKSTPFGKSLEAVFWTWAFKMRNGAGNLYFNYDAHLRIRARHGADTPARPYLERNCRANKRLCCCRPNVKECPNVKPGMTILKKFHPETKTCCKFVYFNTAPSDAKCPSSLMNFGVFGDPDFPNLSPDSECDEGDSNDEPSDKEEDTAANIIPEKCQDCGKCAYASQKQFLRHGV